MEGVTALDLLAASLAALAFCGAVYVARRLMTSHRHRR